MALNRREFERLFESQQIISKDLYPRLSYMSLEFSYMSVEFSLMNLEFLMVTEFGKIILFQRLFFF